MTSTDFEASTAARGVPLCKYFVQANYEIKRQHCNIGECDRWNTVQELQEECSRTRECWSFTTRRVGGLGGDWVPECMKSCHYNGGAEELVGVFPSYEYNTHRKTDVLCGSRILAFREIEAYDDLGVRVRAVDAEFSRAQSEALMTETGEVLNTYEDGAPAANCIDGDMDPYLVTHPPWGDKSTADLPSEVTDGHINGSTCESERWDPDPWLLIDFGQNVTLAKLLIRIGHWQRGTIAGEKFALTNDRDGNDVVWSGQIAGDWYHTPGFPGAHSHVGQCLLPSH